MENNFVENIKNIPTKYNLTYPYFIEKPGISKVSCIMGSDEKSIELWKNVGRKITEIGKRVWLERSSLFSTVSSDATIEDNLVRFIQEESDSFKWCVVHWIKKEELNKDVYSIEIADKVDLSDKDVEFFNTTLKHLFYTGISEEKERKIASDMHETGPFLLCCWSENQPLPPVCIHLDWVKQTMRRKAYVEMCLGSVISAVQLPETIVNSYLFSCFKPEKYGNTILEIIRYSLHSSIWFMSFHSSVEVSTELELIETIGIPEYGDFYLKQVIGE
jgi:hypothetical protein